jgi:hypothetical protein
MDRPFVRRPPDAFCGDFRANRLGEELRIQARVQSARAPIPFDGDIDRLPGSVATTVDFIEGPTIEQIATLVFSEKTEALSV